MNTAKPLVLVNDDELLDDVLRVAAAAGCELERVPDAVSLRARWNHAPLVLLDNAGARDCARAQLPRRQGIVVAFCGTAEQAVWESAVAIGAEQVIGLPESEPWLVGALADSLERPARSPGKVVAVVGGRGGAGASVFAAALAFAALRAQRHALLVDCDPLAGGLDVVLGAEAESGLRWPELQLSGGRVATTSLRSALPGRERGHARLTLLSNDRTGSGPDPEAVTTVITSARRAGELVICDLPRYSCACSRTVLMHADLTVVVVPAEVRACVATRKVIEQLVEQGAAPQLVVRGPAPAGLRAHEVAQAVGFPLLDVMRAEPGLAEALERGQPPSRATGPLGITATAVLKTLCDKDFGGAA